LKVFKSDSQYKMHFGWQGEIVYATKPNPKLIANGFAGIMEEVKKMEIHRQQNGK